MWHTPGHWSVLNFSGNNAYFIDPLKKNKTMPPKDIIKVIKYWNTVHNKKENQVIYNPLKFQLQKDGWSCGYRSLIVIFRNSNFIILKAAYRIIMGQIDKKSVKISNECVSKFKYYLYDALHVDFN